MRRALFLLIVLISCQEITSKEITEVLGCRHELARVKYGIQKRSVSDIWDNIKITAKHAWEYINKLAENTQKKFEDWIAKIKNKAQDLRKAFEEHLKKVDDRVHEIFKNLQKTGEIVKKCLQERKEEIDEIMKNILIDVTNCISNSSNPLKQLASMQNVPIPKQTEFLKGIQSDVNACTKKYKKHEEVEECVQNIRHGIYKNLDKTEESILRNHTEKRGASDELLNTIVGCTTDGIIKSTTVIAKETVQIIECVSQGEQLTNKTVN